MRKPIIAGNWKMNKTVAETEVLLNEIKAISLNAEVEAVVCVPSIDLTIAIKALEGFDIEVGAQNMYFEESGAFTGEISPGMLVEAGVKYVILGHSERREIFGEDDALINKKVLAALSHGLRPILCCGETLEERETKKAEDKVKGQIIAGLKDVSSEDLASVVIAYEPIWAIGTGVTASSDDAESMIAFIRKTITDLYTEALAETVRIQYGGSVKPDNVAEIMAKENIDGALVGGASLKADSFAALVNY